MRGVAAAPEGLAGPEWVELIDPEADAELTKALTAWRAELATADDGLDAAPAPASRLAALRAELKRRGLDGFVVPRADEHQGEYVPRRSQRLAWLTGFTGSAGLAIVLADSAAIFVDGRYTLAVRGQVDTDAFVPHQIPEQSPEAWIAENLPQGRQARLRSLAADGRRPRALRAAPASAPAASFVPVDSNPVDAVWRDRPPAPLAPVLPHPDEFAGESSAAKRTRIAGTVKAKGADVALITAPDSIAWLLNMRGGDVPRTPFALGFALLHGDGHVDLFMDRRKVPDRTAGLARQRRDPGAARRAGRRARHAGQGRQARADRDRDRAGRGPPTACRRPASTLVRDADPVALPKACKNAVELEGIRARPSPRRRRGQPLPGLARRAKRKGGKLREIEASDRLQALRQETGKLRDLSFDTISGAGPNGAIVHYRASEATERTLEPGSSIWSIPAAQYRDGTTDITRTVAIGTPSAGDARPLHPRAQGPYRARHGALPGRHHGLAARRAGALCAVAGRARLRPRHRPRRRHLSLGARGAAAHLQGAQQRRRCSPA